MPLTCASLSAELAIDCDNAPVPGLDNYGYAFNKSEIATLAETADVITAITLNAVTGNQAYKFDGANAFINGTYSLITGGILKGFQHNVSVILPKDDQVGLTQLSNLVNAKTTWVLPKFASTDTATFRLYGKVQGLEGSEVSGDESNADTDGLPQITLSTPEGKKESKAPQHFLDTDYTTSLAALETLRTPVV